MAGVEGADGATVSRSARVLTGELRKLHIRAGEPSSREVATAIGGMSHATVNSAIRGKKIPSWPILSKIVRQLGGDENLFRGLWSATREEGMQIERLPTPTAAFRPEVSVFVSYASIDEKATRGRIGEIVEGVRDAYASLTGEEVGIFLDKSSLAAGDDWRDTIRYELSSSAVFVAFISPSYIRSVECNNEFWEFYRFLEADGKKRLLLPLLFGDRDRIEAASPAGSDLWNLAKSLQTIDITALRSAEPGRAVWVDTTQKIAESIDSVLSAMKSANQQKEAHTDESDAADDEIAPMLLEQMLHFESLAPELVVIMDNLKDSFYKVAAQVNGAGPLMGRATTTKRRLTIARQLGRSIDPIADEVEEQISSFLTNLQVWDVTVRTIFDYLGRARGFSNLGIRESRDTLLAVAEMADTGISVFGEVQGMHDAIGQGRGLSRELDESLRKLQASTLRLGSSKAIFTSWKLGSEELLGDVGDHDQT